MRTIDEAECVASVLLAILAVHAIGATNVSWAAFAGYMVMRGHVLETVQRGLLRVVGTLAGGLLALTAIPLLAPHWWLAALGIFALGTVTLYKAITAKRAYAWLFVGLTFAMVLYDALHDPAIPLVRFVQTRILETVAGTVACVAVSLLSAVTLRRLWPAERNAATGIAGWSWPALRHAAQGGLALALLVIVSASFDVPALSAGAITVMAVMLVPVAGIGTSGFAPVSWRLFYRLIGGLAGAAFSAGFLFLGAGSAPLLILGTALGVAAGRHIENGDHAYRYAGTQFTLTVLVTLVPDSYAGAVITPGLERLAGTLVGMAMVEPVLLLWHLFAPRSAKIPSGRSEPGGV
ncbi:FUSC family protein [Sphingomonas sp. H39-1-10]|uniref:FUSC family protein n=1 Tax=Sphingomonas pollutisoli TaxID=3030829 RepID=UPI0023BA3C2C|nr:FUSC family protein [Sphingomonas pollutisoli]MDF0486954.1 FUSC family protein [Sphingomonas pollutisoli]